MFSVRFVGVAQLRFLRHSIARYLFSFLAIGLIFSLNFLSSPALADLVEDIDEIESQTRPEKKTIETLIQPSTPPRDNFKEKNPQQLDPEAPAQPVVQKQRTKKERKKSKKTQKIDFESDSLRALKDRQQIMLDGNVMITQGDFKLEAQQATIYFKRKSKEPHKIVAKGGVKIFQAGSRSSSRMTAQCSEAVFFNAEQKITLRGSAKLWHGDDFVSGKQITYELDTGWIKADRVEGVVLPGGKK